MMTAFTGQTESGNLGGTEGLNCTVVPRGFESKPIGYLKNAACSGLAAKACP